MKSLLLVALLLTIVVSEHLERPNEATGGPGCPEGHRGLDDHGHHGEHGNHGGQ